MFDGETTTCVMIHIPNISEWLVANPPQENRWNAVPPALHIVTTLTRIYGRYIQLVRCEVFNQQTWLGDTNGQHHVAIVPQSVGKASSRYPTWAHPTW